jgi:hypothetical protein
MTIFGFFFSVCFYIYPWLCSSSGFEGGVKMGLGDGLSNWVCPLFPLNLVR